MQLYIHVYIRVLRQGSFLHPMHGEQAGDIYIYIHIKIKAYIYIYMAYFQHVYKYWEYVLSIYIYKHIVYQHPGNISNILSAKFLVHGWVTRCDFFKALFLGPATRVMGPHPRYVSFPQDGPLLYGCCKWSYGTPYKWGKINGWLGLFHPF